MWTIGQIITEVRKILQDTGTLDVRNPDEELYNAFNVVMTELRRMRPDAFHGQTTFTRYTKDDAATALPVEDQFVMPMVSFIVGYTELKNDQFTNDDRAGILLQKFGQQILVGAA